MVIVVHSLVLPLNEEQAPWGDVTHFIFVVPIMVFVSMILVVVLLLVKEVYLMVGRDYVNQNYQVMVPINLVSFTYLDKLVYHIDLVILDRTNLMVVCLVKMLMDLMPATVLVVNDYSLFGHLVSVGTNYVAVRTGMVPVELFVISCISCRFIVRMVSYS